MYEYVDTFEDMLYALAYNINANHQLTLDIERFSKIVATNLEVTCSIASLYRAVPLQYPGEIDDEKVERMTLMADLIDEIAKAHDYDHAVAATEYAEHLGLS